MYGQEGSFYVLLVYHKRLDDGEGNRDGLRLLIRGGTLLSGPFGAVSVGGVCNVVPPQKKNTCSTGLG